MIKKIIKLLMPNKFIYLLTTIRFFLYDIKRFVKYSNTYYKLNNQTKLANYLTMQYHVIEKGLTMPETRLGFGKNVIIELIDLCYRYINSHYNQNELAFKHSVRILNEYVRFHNAKNHTLDVKIISQINTISEKSRISNFGEQLKFTNEEYFKNSNASFDLFCKSRFSARNFSNKKIPVSTLIDCVDLANESPSACNRQPNRVYIVNKKKEIEAALKLQSGNRGFGHLATSLLIITSDYSAFQSNKERNEPVFNAGLFSMSLAYALHFHKIGACMLNWSVSEENDKALSVLLNIPENEKTTVIIACGYLPSDFKIAKSPRLSSKTITRLVN